MQLQQIPFCFIEVSSLCCQHTEVTLHITIKQIYHSCWDLCKCIVIFLGRCRSDWCSFAPIATLKNHINHEEESQLHTLFLIYLVKVVNLQQCSVPIPQLFVNLTVIIQQFTFRCTICFKLHEISNTRREEKVCVLLDKILNMKIKTIKHWAESLTMMDYLK